MSAGDDYYEAESPGLNSMQEKFLSLAKTKEYAFNVQIVPNDINSETSLTVRVDSEHVHPRSKGLQPNIDENSEEAPPRVMDSSSVVMLKLELTEFFNSSAGVGNLNIPVSISAPESFNMRGRQITPSGKNVLYNGLMPISNGNITIHVAKNMNPDDPLHLLLLNQHELNSERLVIRDNTEGIVHVKGSHPVIQLIKEYPTYLQRLKLAGTTGAKLKHHLLIKHEKLSTKSENTAAKQYVFKMGAWDTAIERILKHKASIPLENINKLDYEIVPSGYDSWEKWSKESPVALNMTPEQKSRPISVFFKIRHHMIPSCSLGNLIKSADRE